MHHASEVSSQEMGIGKGQVFFEHISKLFLTTLLMRNFT